MAETLSARIDTTVSPVVPHVHWMVRLGLAGIFVFHGLQKLTGGTPPAGMLDAMFFGSSAVFWLVAIGELAAGIGIIAGGFNQALVTRIAGAAIFVIMAGAALTVHLPNWHFMEGGAEFQVLVALLGAYFAIRGNAA